MPDFTLVLCRTYHSEPHSHPANPAFSLLSHPNADPLWNHSTIHNISVHLKQKAKLFCYRLFLKEFSQWIIPICIHTDTHFCNRIEGFFSQRLKSKNQNSTKKDYFYNQTLRSVSDGMFSIWKDMYAASEVVLIPCPWQRLQARTPRPFSPLGSLVQLCPSPAYAPAGPPREASATVILTRPAPAETLNTTDSARSQPAPHISTPEPPTNPLLRAARCSASWHRGWCHQGKPMVCHLWGTRDSDGTCALLCVDGVEDVQNTAQADHWQQPCM